MTDGQIDRPPLRRILVVKLGALGNVILSFGQHLLRSAGVPCGRSDCSADDRAVLPEWLARAPWFDEIWCDERPDWWDVPGWLRLRRRLIDGRFDRIYDLQTSGRSSRYFQLLGPGKRPEWSGIAYDCALPDRDPDRDRMHDIDRQCSQLRQAGITEHESADLSWSHADIGRFGLPPGFALLAPGSSPHRLIKRWPIAHYSDLAVWLVAGGVTPVVIGTAPERPLAQAILHTVASAIDLTGRTDLAELTSLARAAPRRHRQ